MADRQPENIGEVLFKSFGQGLQSLSGILETDRQNKIQDLQLQMNMQVQQARMESLRVSTAKNQEALNLMNETPEESRTRKIREAEDEAFALAAADEVFASELLQGLTSQPSIAPFSSALGGLQTISEAPGGFEFDVKFPSGSTLDFGEPKAGQFDVNAFLLGQLGAEEFTEFKTKTGDFAKTERFDKNKTLFEAVGSDPERYLELVFGLGEFKEAELDVNEFLLEQLGEKRFTEFKTSTGEFAKPTDRLTLIKELFGEKGLRSELDPDKVSPTEQRSARKEATTKERNTIFAEAAEVYRNLPLGVKQDLEIGEIITFKDLSRVLVDAGVAGKKESLFTLDWLYKDREGLPEAFTQLQALAERYRNVGTANQKSDVDKVLELLGE